ncbi:GNAT family N-acetyltransferase [Jannaschia seohaensis]|uniref:Acetyltransferase (GNAT) family protein n=1 Tax=Jannaschia seohaensis TaxID=475081 RepID=A0A2Y9ABJ5_9RHOB|nr:GNAT family N-acetyltransferase [Jannaschia seohaensis]PWJ21365.1 acetyltransferase (GNAT) family protein [Jannaschia seohaensis]SSA41971.1 Acetyltransferase (GNAT) family protein [Jannaschia seohaensis]
MVASDRTGEQANRYFGTPAQQALEARADALWQIVSGDPRYSCHGRAVALADRSAEAVGLQIALARLQGVGPSDRLTPEVAQARITGIERAGLVVDTYHHWTADASAVAVAERFLAGHALPDGLSVARVGPETTDEVYDRLDALTQSCGVLLPSASFLLGDVCPAVCLYAETEAGDVAGAAAAVAQTPPGTPHEGHVWWGMLSTAEAWRGHGVAKHLGAKALVDISERARVTHFGTGIREGNAASARLCETLGFSDSGLVDVIAVDPVILSGGRMTK